MSRRTRSIQNEQSYCVAISIDQIEGHFTKKLACNLQGYIRHSGPVVSDSKDLKEFYN